MSVYIGGSQSETLNAQNWDPDWTEFYMGGGDDLVNTPTLNPAPYYLFEGGSGNDSFLGFVGDDTAYGGEGSDILNGWSGSDYLLGQKGNDTLYGGADIDQLVGGKGRDKLFGGEDIDAFDFSGRDSPSINGKADIIMDWQPGLDFIGTKDALNSYVEASTNVTSIEAARERVEESGLEPRRYAFLYNRETDTGYLLGDLSRDGNYEMGVIIKGAGSAADMDPSWINA